MSEWKRRNFAFCFLFLALGGDFRAWQEALGSLHCCSPRSVEEPELCRAVSLQGAITLCLPVLVSLKLRGLKTALQVIYHLLDSNMEKYWMPGTYTLTIFPLLR